MTTNVETVIVFRTIAPLAVAVFDYVFHGRDLPSLRSCLAMGIIVAGALSYVLNDKSFAVSGLRAYVWVVVWLCFLIFNLTYGKYLVSGLGVSSWTAVQYNNTLSMLPTLLFGLLGGEVDKLQAVEWTARGLLWLAASCVVGLGISYAGFKCQSLISATSYTIIGVLNKMLTVLVNTLMWDQHASAAGIASLLVCLAGGALYQQAPLRSDGPERSGLLNAKEESDLPPFPSGPSLSDNLHHRCDVESPEDFSESVRSEAARASPPQVRRRGAAGHVVMLVGVRRLQRAGTGCRDLQKSANHSRGVGKSALGCTFAFVGGGLAHVLGRSKVLRE
eukprot:CAMPEP_0196680958 /NCGR_PEP_ID=MMETSP1090-20130531/8148_1 /TAXON_ID=37098 /ORGANISM="Isochrysis sp, Strain CCMP1244" /LENGTH=332 /DNA_ID=CAMNT_0042019289 /DNA_START=1 /DNA_END=997 /DNA_ORIENTATION=+